MFHIVKKNNTISDVVSNERCYVIYTYLSGVVVSVAKERSHPVSFLSAKGMKGERRRYP